nr:uncharacterized protein LOC107376519 [Nothobranchius furzeri]
MATGLVLWMSCLSLLLDASDGFAISRGGDYRLDPASQNLDDDSTLNFDQGEAFAEQLSGLIPPAYIQPLIAQPPRMVPLKLETV